MMNMKGIVVLAVMVVLVGPSTAHAGKRLTTGSSGLADAVECTVVNVTDEKTITVDVRAYNSSGAVVGQFVGIVAPLSTVTLPNAGPYRWCEIVVVSGGSAKHLRGSMLAYDGGALAAIEPAREK